MDTFSILACLGPHLPEQGKDIPRNIFGILKLFQVDKQRLSGLKQYPSINTSMGLGYRPRRDLRVFENSEVSLNDNMDHATDSYNLSSRPKLALKSSSAHFSLNGK